MTCDQANDLIDAHADGSLDAGVGQELDRHLAACPVCTARLRHLRDLLAQSRSLPRSIEPPGDLWTGIDARLRKTARRRTTYALPAWLMAAAAAALILGSSSLTFLLLRTQAGPAGAYGTVPGSLAALERDYTGAVAEIERVLQANRDAMPPEALAAVERSLRVLDQAILESRAALAQSPESPQLSRMLWATYEQKLDLLKRATRLAGEL